MGDVRISYHPEGALKLWFSGIMCYVEIEKLNGVTIELGGPERTRCGEFKGKVGLTENPSAKLAMKLAELGIDLKPSFAKDGHQTGSYSEFIVAAANILEANAAMRRLFTQALPDLEPSGFFYTNRGSEEMEDAKWHLLGLYDRRPRDHRVLDIIRFMPANFGGRHRDLTKRYMNMLDGSRLAEQVRINPETGIIRLNLTLMAIADLEATYRTVVDLYGQIIDEYI